MVGLGVVEAQGSRDPRQHLCRRARCAPLFEANVVLRRNMRKNGNFFTAKTRGPAARAGRKTHILRLKLYAAATEKRPEFLLVHEFDCAPSRASDPSTVCACIRCRYTLMLAL